MDRKILCFVFVLSISFISSFGERRFELLSEVGDNHRLQQRSVNSYLANAGYGKELNSIADEGMLSYKVSSNYGENPLILIDKNTLIEALQRIRDEKLRKKRSLFDGEKEDLLDLLISCYGGEDNPCVKMRRKRSILAKHPTKSNPDQPFEVAFPAVSERIIGDDDEPQRHIVSATLVPAIEDPMDSNTKLTHEDIRKVTKDADLGEILNWLEAISQGRENDVTAALVAKKKQKLHEEPRQPNEQRHFGQDNRGVDFLKKAFEEHKERQRQIQSQHQESKKHQHHHQEQRQQERDKLLNLHEVTTSKAETRTSSAPKITTMENKDLQRPRSYRLQSEDTRSQENEHEEHPNLEVGRVNHTERSPSKDPRKSFDFSEEKVDSFEKTMEKETSKMKKHEHDKHKEVHHEVKEARPEYFGTPAI